MQMPKRLTDSNKWEDPWFMDLPNKYKLFWIYLLDNCDHAGIWKVNFKVANFYIGDHLEPSEVKRIFNDKVKIIDDTYWFIEKFIEFQYGGIKNDAVGKSVQKLLKRHNLIAPSMPLSRGYEGTKDKDKDKVKVKVKDKDTEDLPDLVLWAEQIKNGNDHVWDAMRCKKSDSEIDEFVSVAIRNDWTIDTQQKFRNALKGFSSYKTQSKQPVNPGKLQ